VSAEFLSRLPASLAIGLGGVTLAFNLSYPLGMLAYTRGGLWDGLTRVLAIAGQAVPSFLVCTLIIAVLGVKLRWIPFYRLPPERAVVAPMLVVGLYSLGQLSRIAYAHAEQQAAEPYVMAAALPRFHPLAGPVVRCLASCSLRTGERSDRQDGLGHRRHGCR